MNKKEIIKKVCKKINEDLGRDYNSICNNYDQNEIFYDEIMKYKDISKLEQKDFDFINLCIDYYIKTY